MNFQKQRLKILKKTYSGHSSIIYVWFQLHAGIFVKFGIALNPMIAALAMTVSSLTVVLNALRLKS